MLGGRRVAVSRPRARNAEGRDLGLPSGDEDPRQYLVADVTMGGGLERDELHFFFGDRGSLLLIPLPENRWLVVCDLPSHHDAAKEQPTVDELRTVVAERGPSAASVGGPRWLSYFRIN